ALAPLPKRDTNNWAPRFGFNWRAPSGPGILRSITGDGKLVLRGGYSRTYDNQFLNLAANVGTAFPFQKTDQLAPRTPNALNALRTIATIASIADPNQLARTTVSGDFRAPYAEQFATQVQRELGPNWAFSAGWVATKGTALFQTIDANP